MGDPRAEPLGTAYAVIVVAVNSCVVDMKLFTGLASLRRWTRSDFVNRDMVWSVLATNSRGLLLVLKFHMAHDECI